MSGDWSTLITAFVSVLTKLSSFGDVGRMKIWGGGVCFQSFANSIAAHTSRRPGWAMGVLDVVCGDTPP